MTSLSTALALCLSAAPAAPAAAPAAPPKPKFDAIDRATFNRRAQEEFLPLFWRADANGNKALDVDELAFLWGPQGLKREEFIAGQAFTPRFAEAYALLSKEADGSKLPEAEQKRQAAVRTELSQGRATLIETDLSKATPEDQAIADAVFKAAVWLERIYAKQLGTDALVDKVGKDAASQSLFHRNQSPFCVAPRTENDKACTALTAEARRVSGLYPADLQADPKFCAALEKQKNGKALMDHFSTVVRDGKGFKAVPYSEAYKTEMEEIAKLLDGAADAIKDDREAAFKTYLSATAKAFRTNDWEPANAAWVAMSATNSRWYLRLQPDEVYYEPCAWKAGFAINFSRINPESLAWQKRLEPVKNDMEKALAALAGPPYKARDVKFKLPDFIDVVLNSGDQRNPHGATIGQSLPNWGPVAEKGGRTVVMANLYTDQDSQASLKEQMASLFCPATMAHATTNPGPAIMSVVLHEAAHNLGPSHDYKVNGKEDDEVFGGPLAATMEELKAQTSALYFSEWLVTRGIVTADEAKAAHVRDVAWGFGHVSRGMYDAAGKPRNYSQLASIQLGTLHQAGVMTWKKDDRAANGSDVGCVELDFAKWTPTVDGLAKRVLMTKGKGDKAEAEKMKKEFVDAKDEWATLKGVITERWLRAPKATFVYSIKR